MQEYRTETDSLGKVKVPKHRLWGAQTQRSLKYFSIGEQKMPKEMIPAYAIEKKAAALVNCQQGRLSKEKTDLIVKVCDELIRGKFHDHFPLHVWMTGSGTQFNMNVNEVIANRCSQLCKKPLGSKIPVHPNDDVNMSQSSNDTFPSVMHISAALGITKGLLPALTQLKEGLHKKAKQWKNIIKLGRTHLQDATPLTLGQEFSGYVSMLEQDCKNIEHSLLNIYELPIGGTAVGTGIHTLEGFDKEAVKWIARLTKLPFLVSPSKFGAQGAHNALVQLSGSLKTLAVSLYKIANDIRLLSSGPRSGFYELILPANEPGSSIMPGKINPTQCEALSMVAIQVMANDLAVTLGGGGGHLEMNVYKPLIIYNVLRSLRILRDGCLHFNRFLVQGMKPNLKRIRSELEKSLMLITSISPIIGYDKASKIVHYAMDKDLTLKEAALALKYVTASEFDRLINLKAMCAPAKKPPKRKPS